MADVKDLIKKVSESHDDVIPSLLKCIELVKSEFVADQEDASNLIGVVTGETNLGDGTVHLLQLIADITKLDTNRPHFTDKLLMLKLIDYLMSDCPDICLQSVRSLGNICAENEDACNLFMECGGVEKILSKGECILASDDERWTRIIPNACACIRNMVINNNAVQEKFLTNDALLTLWKYVEKYHATHFDITTYAISGIEALADSESGLRQLENKNILVSMRTLMSKCSDDILKTILKEILLEYGRRENTSELLCRCGFVETLCKLIEQRTNFKETECNDELMKEMADLVVLLTSAEEGFSHVEPEFLNRISCWVESPNSHIQVSAGLILGNYARSEEHCANVVANKIHENLINVMKENLDDESFYDRFQAYGSCLRNLSIPVESKSILIEAGLHLLAADLVKKPSLGVQFKGLGIIRLLVQGNAPITLPLLSDNEFISKVCELSDVSCVSSVPSEAQRLMAALFKHNNSDELIRNAISLGAFKPVVALLSSDHMIMQNEGLVGLIIAIANVCDCLPSLKENEILSKVTRLMGKSEVQTQTLFNCITLIQAISSLDGGMDTLKEHNVKETLENIKDHTEEIIRNKVVETLALIN